MKDMIRINQIKLNIGLNNWDKALRKRAANILKVNDSDIEKLIIVKHSIDARKKPELYDVFSIDVCLRGKSRKEEEQIVKRCRDKNVSIVELKEYSFAKKIGLNEGKELSAEGKIADKRIVVIGAGPAGLFCGYELAMAGFKPLILERGADVDKRLDIVSKFWKTGKLDLKTNVQFGEGGAGTFSDGKLNTMVKDKEGRGSEALDIFVKNGAPEKIKYESKPHIGTDILKDVVKNIRNEIIKSGGEVLFETQVTELVLDEAGALKAVVAGDKEYPCEACVLAIGHSARDTFKMLYDREVDMQPKPFAVGFRVEHPQSMINKSQYGIAESEVLPAAPYKLTTTTTEGRGVYSFCMCPGGYVVNASSEEGMLAVNGMSYSGRDGLNANSAIIITVDPKDFGSDDVLAGVEFQRRLEKKAFELAGNVI